ncbi:MAG: ABC transporter ATP-binding protein [Oscillospiraceae bacterium]|nr:ABC transporter ATP-binding protein [Oscillospiraceae bacterium]
MARNKFDVDERLESQFSFDHIKRLARYLIPFKWLMLLTIGLMLLTSVLNMLAPIITREAIDVRLPARDMRGILILGAILVVIYLINAIIVKFRMRAMATVGQNLVANLRRDIFEHLQELPFDFYDSRPHGKILVRVINYVNSINNLLTGGLINLITDLFTVIVVMLLMFSLSLELSIVMLCGVVVFSGIIFAMKNRQRRVWQDYSAKQSNLNAYIHESICGIKVTQSFSREKENQRIFETQCENVRSSYMKAKIIDICNWPMVETISTITTCAVFLIGGANLLNGGGITAGTLVAFVGYVNLFWTPVLSLCNYYNQLINTAAYLERIFEVMDTPALVTDKPGAVEMPPIEGRVDFKNVTFAYEEGVDILKGLSFSADKGQTIAVVGPTGAGKTTIINLLSRFYDIQGGEILIDGENITKYTLNSLRSQVGVMLQDTFIFSGTVMDNIRYGRLDATDEEVIAAAKTVCAHEFIETLENGYYTEVNERGSRLSVGQRQLISFARALLADPRILILDEATSSIDTRTEQALQLGLNRLLAGRTSFVIAHRLSTIRGADCIMYIDGGRIVESGTHEELMAKKGAYYSLCTSQYELN